MQRHDAFMRMPWNKSKVEQRDLVDEANEEYVERLTSDAVEAGAAVGSQTSVDDTQPRCDSAEGVPLLVSVECLEEDPRNPRTEFPEEEIAELAEDIALRGILQPIVVHRLAEEGRYRILFGAKRLRARSRRGSRPFPSSSAQRPMTPMPRSPRTRSATA